MVSASATMLRFSPALTSIVSLTSLKQPVCATCKCHPAEPDMSAEGVPLPPPDADPTGEDAAELGGPIIETKADEKEKAAVAKQQHETVVDAATDAADAVADTQ